MFQNQRTTEFWVEQFQCFVQEYYYNIDFIFEDGYAYINVGWTKPLSVNGKLLQYLFFEILT